MWCTPMSGLPVDQASVFPYINPTRRAPTSPGPEVTAIASMSSRVAPARSNAASATARQLARCSREAISGSLDFDALRRLDDQRAMERLVALKGVGRWSAEIYLIWVLGRLDVFYSAPPHVTGFYLIDSLLAGDLELFRAALSQLILPAATLAIFSLAPIARMTRASMLAVLSSDFVRAARASGLSPRKVIVTYAFRNAMLPVITTLGMVFSFLLGANVLVEKVFAWPGIGSYAIEALIASDYAPVQGFVLAMAVLYVLLNLMIDMLYGFVDPRVKLEG